jgi:hypothetical protein
MISLLADFLSIIASWLGLGVLFGLVIVIKGWQIIRQYRRSR